MDPAFANHAGTARPFASPHYVYPPHGYEPRLAYMQQTSHMFAHPPSDPYPQYMYVPHAAPAADAGARVHLAPSAAHAAGAVPPPPGPQWAGVGPGMHPGVRPPLPPPPLPPAVAGSTSLQSPHSGGAGPAPAPVAKEPAPPLPAAARGQVQSGPPPSDGGSSSSSTADAAAAVYGPSIIRSLVQHASKLGATRQDRMGLSRREFKRKILQDQLTGILGGQVPPADLLLLEAKMRDGQAATGDKAGGDGKQPGPVSPSGSSSSSSGAAEGHMGSVGAASSMNDGPRPIVRAGLRPVLTHETFLVTDEGRPQAQAPGAPGQQGQLRRAGPPHVHTGGGHGMEGPRPGMAGRLPSTGQLQPPLPQQHQHVGLMPGQGRPRASGSTSRASTAPSPQSMDHHHHMTGGHTRQSGMSSIGGAGTPGAVHVHTGLQPEDPLEALRHLLPSGLASFGAGPVGASLGLGPSYNSSTSTGAASGINSGRDSPASRSVQSLGNGLDGMPPDFTNLRLPELNGAAGLLHSRADTPDLDGHGDEDEDGAVGADGATLTGLGAGPAVLHASSGPYHGLADDLFQRHTGVSGTATTSTATSAGVSDDGPITGHDILASHGHSHSHSHGHGAGAGQDTRPASVVQRDATVTSSSGVTSRSESTAAGSSSSAPGSASSAELRAERAELKELRALVHAQASALVSAQAMQGQLAAALASAAESRERVNLLSSQLAAAHSRMAELEKLRLAEQSASHQRIAELEKLVRSLSLQWGGAGTVAVGTQPLVDTTRGSVSAGSSYSTSPITGDAISPGSDDGSQPQQPVS